ncbi:hypothetical protein [Pseudomonas orientalis]|uniref:Uncharacterized protein n=1 Tax=Pseudomonas orientalis TaxID=76758 RepID=A0A4Q7D547_9PSED|nr:hypothetical protein [Pseudomonas orientalis]RZI33148.1 hypothetical protein EUX57_03910 [Pseudomonas orientalis]
MNFLESIKTGIEKASQADINLKQVNELLSSISSELHLFTGKDIKLSKTVSTAGNIRKIATAFENDSTPREFMDSDQLSLIKDKQSLPVAKWRQNTGGFPCIITFDGSEYICDEIDELAVAMKDLLSTTNFGKTLTKLMTD